MFTVVLFKGTYKRTHGVISINQYEMKLCHLVHPSLHTDRPRCYALMREDYLWSPLQSACSMQHLRSVPSLGRQCSPDPTVLAHPATPLPWVPVTFPVFLLLRPPALIYLPCRYPQWCVGTLHSCLLPQVLTSLHVNLPWQSHHHHHALLLGTHTVTNTSCQKSKPKQRPRKI